MTPEQFVFWISGYFSGGRDNESHVVVEDIMKALKEVKLPANHVLMFGGDL